MDAFVKRSPEERRIFFEGAAAPLNLAPLMVEKDFWVCWTLKELFRLPVIGEHLIFKGDTSPSKVFPVIERFSEDVDVSIDRGFLGFDGPNEPEAGASNNEKQRHIEALRTACQQSIANGLHPALTAAIRSKLQSSETWSLRGDDEETDGQTLLFEYPPSVPLDNQDRALLSKEEMDFPAEPMGMKAKCVRETITTTKASAETPGTHPSQIA